MIVRTIVEEYRLTVAYAFEPTYSTVSESEVSVRDLLGTHDMSHSALEWLC